MGDAVIGRMNLLPPSPLEKGAATDGSGWLDVDDLDSKVRVLPASG